MARSTAGQLFPDEATSLRERFAREGTSPAVIEAFRDIILRHYKARGRDLPFRHPDQHDDPYKVIVSEIMLQQTQADRVAGKFMEFTARFPTFEALASATNEDVIKAWIGLGYNRRALALKRIATEIVASGGNVPRDPAALQRFPGIGPNTAASIAVYAFNQPHAFVETNIRTVFSHFFFHGKDTVDDKDILDLVERTVDRADPRTWFYALMDYGMMLKRQQRKTRTGQPRKQRAAPFKGSDREIRGKVLKLLLGGPMTAASLASQAGVEGARLQAILAALEREGFVTSTGNGYRIA